MTITLDQFRASGRDCDDLGAALDDGRWDYLDGGKARGRLYLDVLYIERIMHSEGEWSLILGNGEWVSNDLPSLEARLYEWALSEGYCDAEPGGLASMNTMRACTFTFEDSPEFAGFTDGSTWNGFDNVWVTPEVRDQIVAYFRAITDDPDTEEGNRDMLAIPAEEDGLVSLANGYATQIVEPMKSDESPADDNAYGIWCEVWGGVTGRREAWLKQGGRIATFATLEDAEAEAADLMRGANGPNARASFRYTAREI